MTLASPQRVVVVQMRMALACVVVTLLGGAIGVLHYIPTLSPALHEMGLGLTKLRPLHTTFASLWIFGAAIAVIYHYLAHTGDGLDRGDLRRFWFHTACWLTAGVGIVVTLALGVFSGREYLGFHPILSALLLAGWLALAVNVLKRTFRDFWHQPIYIYFWTTGILYFIYTFIEGHAYLLETVQEYPTRDISLQWKSCGTLVGSFNFLVYGCLIYVSERLSGDKHYGQSTMAFSLFAVGCLNSFTNFAHHTYHVPQGHAIKWIAFVVSMVEALILLKLLSDIVKGLANRVTARRGYDSALGFLTSARWWTAAMLTLSLVISVPTLNSLIHGTQMVTGHAMGTELGIDSMVLFGCVTFLLGDLYRRVPSVQAKLDQNSMRRFTIVLNVAMGVLVAWLSLSGTVHGIYRYNGKPSPAWVSWGVFLFPIFGLALAMAILHLLGRWIPLLFGVAGRQQAAAPELAEPQQAAAAR